MSPITSEAAKPSLGIEPCVARPGGPLLYNETQQGRATGQRENAMTQPSAK